MCSKNLTKISKLYICLLFIIISSNIVFSCPCGYIDEFDENEGCIPTSECEPGTLDSDYIKDNPTILAELGEGHSADVAKMLENDPNLLQDMDETDIQAIYTQHKDALSSSKDADLQNTLITSGCYNTQTEMDTQGPPTEEFLNSEESTTASAGGYDLDALSQIPVSAWSKDNVDFFTGGALELMLQISNFKTAYDSYYGEKLDTNELPSGTQSNLQNQQLTYQDPDGAVSSFQLDTFDPTDKFKFMNDGSVNFNDYNLKGAKNLSFFVFALLFLAFVFLDGRRSPLVPYSAPRMGLPPLRLRLCPA